jgi:aminopeptidase N
MTLRRVAPARQGRSLWRRPRSFGRVLLLAAGLLAAVRSLAGDVAHVDLDVSLDPDRRMLSVSGSLVLPAREAREVVLHGASEVRRFRVDERPVTASRVRSGEVTLLQWRIDRPTSRPVSIDFAYALPLAAMDTGMDHRAVLGAHVPAVGEAGAFVPASTAWHPALPDRMMTHRVAIATPEGWRGVLPGRLVEEAPLGVGYRAVFESRRPLPGIDLVAAPYVVAECHVVLADGRKLPVRTYFHAELQELARGYLDAAAGYIERYDRSIGAYAHPGYSIVSSPLPTGFGMPGIAYFGRQVVRLPFIRSTSLGHEVLHDWWGNGVHPDYARGNWAEGLTTFMADYAYREAESAEAARRVREGWLRDLAAVPPALDRPLSAFVARRHGADQAIGYNKTAFVFFMLRDRIGEQAFTQGVRSFWRRHDGGVASWDDLRRAFEQAAGTDLGPFFEQWVQRAGAPRIEI